MAIRKKNTSASKDAVKSASKWAAGKIFKKSAAVIMLILLGGLLFNLDRVGNCTSFLQKYKDVLPSFISRFLPEKNIPEGVSAPDKVLEGTVIKVADGDTMMLLVSEQGDQKKYKVRFFGIDAPESSQPYGMTAGEALSRKILNKKVETKVISVDRYGRSVAKVYADGSYVNLQMVAEGHAWFYPDYAAHEYDLEKAQEDARSARKGLWQNPSPQPPWLYRKENRK